MLRSPARRSLALLLSLGASTAVGAACSSSPVARPTLGAAAAVDASPGFATDPPSVYVAKVKNVLTGLPVTDAEVAEVSADPTKLASLVDQWMQTPEYTAKILVFFKLAFQQTQISTADFSEMIPNAGGIGVGPLPALLVQNVRESFGRTVLELVREGQPLTSVMTTTRFMMTPPLMELYAYLDTSQADDNEKVTDAMKVASPTGSVYVTAQPIAYSDSIDPTSPSYLHFSFPDLAKAVQTVPGCTVDPRVYAMSSHVIHELIYGGLDLFKATPTMLGTCAGYASAADAQLTTGDFASWKMVDVRAPAVGEATTRFFDVSALRSASELVIHTPHVGFFSTPAFFANWQTNTSNEMRVTMNQTLIVATGMAVDGTDPTVPATTPGLDAQHAAPGSACFGCHQTLDPTRAILQSTYSYGYGTQSVASLVAQPGLFAFQGVIANVGSLADLGSVLAKHPAFPTAWAEKLCYYVNSQACDPNDPELTRIVGDFVRANYDWNTLVREIVTSPLTTNAAPTVTGVDDGVTVAVARRDHLCALLNARLGLPDVCGLDIVEAKASTSPIATIAAGLPSDGYGRGAPIPILPNQPTLFYRAGTENICEAVASELIDATSPPAGARTYASGQSSAAIADFVSNLMGLTASDPRSGPSLTLLQQHFTDAEAAGASPTDALKSTFVVACLAPSVVGMGM